MGTNYYAIPKVSDADRTKMKKAIDNDDYLTVRNLLPERVHIGKSSLGWQFLFNPSAGKTKAEVYELIDTSQVFTEYGDTISPKEFWTMVDNKRDMKAELEYGYISDGLCFSNSYEFS